MTGRFLCPALLLGALFLTSPAAAQSAAPQTPQTEDQLKAQQHFQKAKELYSQGKYTDAVHELELARNLDPKAKDLVFNLGIVHEKLGKYDEAIAFFRQYMEMEGVTAQERTKAETNIKRIEGAKQEVGSKPPPSGPNDLQGGSGGDQAPKGPQPPEEKPAHGRVDAATIAAGSVAIVGFGVGTVFGIIAVSSKPNDFVTGRDGTYAQFEAKNADAHNAAIVADVGLAVGIVATLATAYLYFGRTKDPQRTGFMFGPGMLVGTFR
jgi:tetratricopeptide (TPR) repeat protein